MLLAVCQKFGIETPDDVFPQIAHGFAGGIGNSGAVCGAVIGAVMAIGLKRGRPDSVENVLRELQIPAELRGRFEAEMGALNCRDLTGMDLTTREGVDGFMNSDAPQRVCIPAVNAAYRLAVELLEEPS